MTYYIFVTRAISVMVNIICYCTPSRVSIQHEVSGASSMYGAQIPLANALSMNFKEFLSAVNHTTWRHVWLTGSIIYSLSIVWGIDSLIGHMCLTAGRTLSWQTINTLILTACARKKHLERTLKSLFWFTVCKCCTCGLSVTFPYLLYLSPVGQA